MSLSYTPPNDVPTGVTVEAVEALVESGASEKGAWALAAHDAGVKTADIQTMFGHANPRISGNLVNAAKRAVGRESEIAAPSSGTKATTFVDPVQLITDQLDRARTALDNVERPVTEAREALSKLDSDDGVSEFVNGRLASIDERIAALREEKKALTTDPADAVKAERERLTGKVESAEKAAAENADTYREAIAKNEATLAVLTA